MNHSRLNLNIDLLYKIYSNIEDYIKSECKIKTEIYHIDLSIEKDPEDDDNMLLARDENCRGLIELIQLYRSIKEYISNKNLDIDVDIAESYPLPENLVGDGNIYHYTVCSHIGFSITIIRKNSRPYLY